MATFFNEFFGVSAEAVDEYGAFNVSLINDLPLFIDPFLLFNSENLEYQELHREILKYIIFLRDEIAAGRTSSDLINAWFRFPEVKQNWLGFSLFGNRGTGLGQKFAMSLSENLKELFSDFGAERISHGSHIEKICLISDGVGRDNISDFTLNLILDYICRYTEIFARDFIDQSLRRKVWIQKAKFNYETKSWQRARYELPYIDGDYVLLTPKDMLTRDENWINKGDMVRQFEEIPMAIPDNELRGQVFAYFDSVLKRPGHREPSPKERAEAVIKTYLRFPDLVDWYILYKENNGDDAADISSDKVALTKFIFEQQVKSIQSQLANETDFYRILHSTYEETHKRLAFFKEVIEKKAGIEFFGMTEYPYNEKATCRYCANLFGMELPQTPVRRSMMGAGPLTSRLAAVRATRH